MNGKLDESLCVGTKHCSRKQLNPKNVDENPTRLNKYAKKKTNLEDFQC